MINTLILTSVPSNETVHSWTGSGSSLDCQQSPVDPTDPVKYDSVIHFYTRNTQILCSHQSNSTNAHQILGAGGGGGCRNICMHAWIASVWMSTTRVCMNTFGYAWNMDNWVHMEYRHLGMQGIQRMVMCAWTVSVVEHKLQARKNMSIASHVTEMDTWNHKMSNVSQDIQFFCQTQLT